MIKFSIIIVVLIAIVSFACAEPQEIRSQSTTISNSFHIGVWYCPYHLAKRHQDAKSRDEEQFKMMQEYGIDTVIFGGDIEAAKKVGMNMVHHGGVWAKMMAYTDVNTLEQMAKKAVEKYPASEYPNLLGYYPVDEPTADMAAQVGNVAKALQKADPNRPVFTFIPQPAHLDPIITAMDAKVLCHHIYPLHPAIDGYPLGFSEIENGAFNQQVNVAIALAASRKIPAWILVPAFHAPDGLFRIATEAEINYMTWYPIIRGAKGISYFIWNSTSRELNSKEELYGLVNFSYEPTYLLKHLKKTLDPIVKNREIFGQWQQAAPHAWIGFESSVHVNFFTRGKERYVALFNPSLKQTIKGEVRFSKRPSSKIVDIVSGKEYEQNSVVEVEISPANAVILTEKGRTEK